MRRLDTRPQKLLGSLPESRTNQGFVNVHISYLFSVVRAYASDCQTLTCGELPLPQLRFCGNYDCRALLIDF